MYCLLIDIICFQSIPKVHIVRIWIRYGIFVFLNMRKQAHTHTENSLVRFHPIYGARLPAYPDEDENLSSAVIVFVPDVVLGVGISKSPLLQL